MDRHGVDEGILTRLAAQVDPDHLWEYLDQLPGPRHRRGNPSAVLQSLEYLRRRFRANGWAVVDQPCTDPALGRGLNLIATLPGTRTDALVVVGAHHDTVQQTPGADDNGSGLAGLLELARLLSRASWEATLQLVAFDFEETEPEVMHAPFAGSRAYVAALGAGISLRGAFIFEMIGYASNQPESQRVPQGLERWHADVVRRLAAGGRRGDFIAVLGNTGKQTDAFTRAAGAAASDLNVVAFEVPQSATFHHLFRSDHAAFWEANLPAVMLTDTAEFRNPHYHRASDAVETLMPKFWKDVVAATLVAAGALASPIAPA